MSHIRLVSAIGGFTVSTIKCVIESTVLLFIYSGLFWSHKEMLHQHFGCNITLAFILRNCIFLMLAFIDRQHLNRANTRNICLKHENGENTRCTPWYFTIFIVARFDMHTFWANGASSDSSPSALSHANLFFIQLTFILVTFSSEIKSLFNSLRVSNWNKMQRQAATSTF